MHTDFAPPKNTSNFLHGVSFCWQIEYRDRVLKRRKYGLHCLLALWLRNCCRDEWTRPSLTLGLISNPSDNNLNETISKSFWGVYLNARHAQEIYVAHHHHVYIIWITSDAYVTSDQEMQKSSLPNISFMCPYIQTPYCYFNLSRQGHHSNQLTHSRRKDKNV